MLPKFVDAPNTPTLNLLFLCLHWISFTFIIPCHLLYERQKWQLKWKRVSTYTTNTGIPHCDLIRSILCLFVYTNAKLVSWYCIIASKVTWLYETSPRCPWVTRHRTLATVRWSSHSQTPKLDTNHNTSKESAMDSQHSFLCHSLRQEHSSSTMTNTFVQHLRKVPGSFYIACFTVGSLWNMQCKT